MIRRQWMSWSGLAILAISIARMTVASDAWGQTDEPVSASHRHAMIVIGLAGDDEHREKFRRTAGVWRTWLTQVAGVDPANLHLFSADKSTAERNKATAENLASSISNLEQGLDADDSLWVFLLGHGSVDQRHGWFHLPGPDLNSAQWAGLFARIKSNEQVFWLTHAGSGSFVKAMSQPERIIISATDNHGEVNETRFPHKLAEIMQGQIDVGHEATEAKSMSVVDLFEATTRLVISEYEGDQLVPTEHAMLDDNGDGEGTEIANLVSAPEDQADANNVLLDGVIASRILVQPQSMTKPKVEE